MERTLSRFWDSSEIVLYINLPWLDSLSFLAIQLSRSNILPINLHTNRTRCLVRKNGDVHRSIIEHSSKSKRQVIRGNSPASS
jgi:hypothetical protein